MLYLFIKDSGGRRKEWSKRHLAYNCDLYDKNAKLPSIFLSFRIA